MMNFEIISMWFSPVPAKRSGHLPFLLRCPRSFLFVRGWWSAFYLFTTRNFFVRLRRERRTTMMEKECPENCAGNHIISLCPPLTPHHAPFELGCPRKKTNCPPDGQLLSLLPPVRSRAYVFGYWIVQSFTPARDISRVASFRNARHQSVEMVFLYPIYSSTMIYLHRRIRISASHSPSLGLHKWMCSRRA